LVETAPPSTGMVAIADALQSARAERAFYLGMTMLTTAIVLWGFAPTFFLRGMVPRALHSYLDPPPQPGRWLYILHGAVFSVWVALALTQVALVASRRTDLHRRLGQIAFVLTPVMVALGIAVGSWAVVHGFHDVPQPAAVFLAVPLFGTALFAAFAAAGLAARRNPQAHKRWMLLAMIAVAEAGWVRIAPLNPESLPPWISTELVVLVPLFAWDTVRLGHPHRVTLLGGFATVAVLSLRFWIGSSAAWLALVRAIYG
jgi:FtsH-binding integral membrane protein